MPFNITPHLNFRDRARAALEFYGAVFEAKPMFMTYGDAQQGSANEASKIIFGEVASSDGFRIMAFDILEPRPFDSGANAFFVCLRGSPAETIQARWKALSEGATILHPLGPAPWTTLYGMLKDRFEITWIFSLDAGAA